MGYGSNGSLNSENRNLERLQSMSSRQIALQSQPNSPTLLLLLTPDRSKGSNNNLPALVRYTSLSQSHFSSLNIKFSYAKRKQAGLWSKQEETYSLFSFAILFETSGRFPFTNTDYAISIFHIKHLYFNIQYSITKLHIPLLVNTMNICIPVANNYRFYEHEKKKNRIFIFLVKTV